MDIIDKTLFHKVVEEIRSERYSILTNLSILTILKEDKKTGRHELMNTASTYVTQLKYIVDPHTGDYSLNTDISLNEKIAIRTLSFMFSDILTEAFIDKLNYVILSQNKQNQRFEYFENLDIDIDQKTIDLDEVSIYFMHHIALDLTKRLLNNLYKKTGLNNGRVKIHITTNRVVGLFLLTDVRFYFKDNYYLSISEHDYFKDKILLVPSYEYVDEVGNTVNVSFANSVVTDLSNPNNTNNLKGFLSSIINIPIATIVKLKG